MKQALIIGMGRFGRNIAKKLNNLDVQILAVDISESNINDVMPYVTNAVIGDATQKEFLQTLGVSNFDVCFVTIGDDFLASLEATSFLKELGAKKVVSRAAKNTQEKFLLRNGADHVVYPEREIGNLTAVRYFNDIIIEYIPVGDNISIYEVSTPIDWVGKTVTELDVRRAYHINIIAVRTNNEVNSIISPDYTFNQKDSIFMLGDEHNIKKFMHQFET